MKLSFNVSQIQAKADGTGGYLETGLHILSITAVEEKTASTTGRVYLELTLQGSEGKCWAKAFPPMEGDKPRTLASWRNFLEAIGYTEEELNAGDVDMDTEEWVGREAAIFFVAGDKAIGKQSEVHFLNPIAYAEEQESGARLQAAENKAAQAQAQAPAAPAAPPPPPKPAAAPAPKSAAAPPPPPTPARVSPPPATRGPGVGGLAGLRKPA